MKPLLALASLVLFAPPVQASATPYAVASRLCEMMNNGVSGRQAWDYVVTEYTQGQMGTMSATFGPPRLGGLGGGIGYGLAHGIQAGMSLRGMRGDVTRLTSQMCPQHGFYLSGGSSRISEDRDMNTYTNTTDPSSYIPK